VSLPLWCFSLLNTQRNVFSCSLQPQTEFNNGFVAIIGVVVRFHFTELNQKGAAAQNNNQEFIRDYNRQSGCDIMTDL